MDWTARALALGADGAAELPALDVPLNPAFLEDCRRNACGYYGRCWTCPPDAGPVETLMERVRGYRTALVFRTAHPLLDAFDGEGMRAAARAHNDAVRAVRDAVSAREGDCLALGAGACGLCGRCAREENVPCRFPTEALLSLEACGVDAGALARKCGLSLAGGKDRVVYLGMVLYGEQR